MFVSGPIFDLEPGKFAHSQGAFLVTFDLDCELEMHVYRRGGGHPCVLIGIVFCYSVKIENRILRLYAF